MTGNKPPLDELDDDYEPTFLARLRMRFAGRRKMARIKKSAKEIILSQFRETEDERVQKELEQQEADQEQDFRDRRNREVGTFGRSFSAARLSSSELTGSPRSTRDDSGGGPA